MLFNSLEFIVFFPIVIFVLSPSVGFALFISAGVAYSLTPIYRLLFSKMRSKINK